MIAPMLASLAEAPLHDAAFVYEPKYDGIRAIAEAGPGGPVRLWSRNGNDKTKQFPEIVDALTAWAKRRRTRVVLDGEVVALDTKGQPVGFQHLQGRIHLASGGEVLPLGRVAFIAFDLLHDGAVNLCTRPLTDRRKALEKIFSRTGSPLLRISDVVYGDGRALYRQAVQRGWEGLIAKHAASQYRPGKRTPDWRKLKIVKEQEFVVGGWTEPRSARTHFGALIVGIFEGKRLVYAGHVGTGFDQRELARLMGRLKPLEIKTCPFVEAPGGNERPHWVKPTLVAQVKFSEWTSAGNLRHPVYLGLRDDKKASAVVREDGSRLHASSARRLRPRARPPVEAEPVHVSDIDRLVRELETLEDSRKDGILALAGGTLKVSNLHKVFWPKSKLTKGDLLRYYARVARFVLPAVADRPLVMKRFPNGVTAKSFYQHRAPDDVPAGVRTAVVRAVDARPQIVGGDLLTLLYTAQLAAISQDPWFSRVDAPAHADYAALDLDPSEGVTFACVLDVARAIHEELQKIGAVGVPKTSGSRGLHVYVPLPQGTPYEAGLLFCQIVAAIVCQKHPKLATTERAVKARGARVYIDCMQNALGKTLATAYSARASEYAGVSTPLTWKEVAAGVDPRDFTIESAPARFESAGDLWSALRTGTGVDLERVARLATAAAAGASSPGTRASR